MTRFRAGYCTTLTSTLGGPRVALVQVTSTGNPESESAEQKQKWTSLHYASHTPRPTTSSYIVALRGGRHIDSELERAPKLDLN
jgi:hypothetical protein